MNEKIFESVCLHLITDSWKRKIVTPFSFSRRLCQDVKYGWAYYLAAGILPCVLGLFWEAQHRNPPSVGSMHPLWATKPRKWGANSI
jgi:hypothetical protein